jgi:hypothetical protein
MPQLLATMEDFAAARGVSFDPTDLQALIALEGASGTVSAYCNRDFAYVEDDEVIVFPLGTAGLILPDPPVHEVSAITLIAHDATETDLVAGDWFVDGPSGILYRMSTTGTTYPWSWGWHWYVPTARVQVTYTHGYVMPGEAEIDDVPDLPAELSLATISIASRNITTSAQGGQSVRSKSVGSFTVTYGDTQTTVDELGITAAERQVLERYRMRATP